MAERLKAHAWKACVRESVPWVRIPLSPPGISHFSPALDENSTVPQRVLVDPADVGSGLEAAIFPRHDTGASWTVAPPSGGTPGRMLFVSVYFKPSAAVPML